MSSDTTRSTSLERCRQRRRAIAAILTMAVLTEIALIRLGRTYGSTELEQATPLPGDDIIDHPVVATNHAITINASPDRVWPWLTHWDGTRAAGTRHAGSTGRSSRRTGPAPRS